MLGSTTPERTVTESQQQPVDDAEAPSASLSNADEPRVIELETRDVSVWFGQRKVLEGVNIAFPKRTVTALIGPSGCGKSTFIRTLNRLHELIPGAALAGSVLYEGQDIYEPTVDPVKIRLSIESREDTGTCGWFASSAPHRASRSLTKRWLAGLNATWEPTSAWSA